MKSSTLSVLPRRVVAGEDGTPSGGDAVALGAAMADAAGAPLEVVGVYAAAPVGWAGTPPAYDELFRREADQLLDGARERLADRADTTYAVVRGRSPADGLHRHLEAGEPAIAVVGASRTSGLGRIVAGSVTEQVLQGATVPVAVAPRGWADGPRTVTSVGVAYNRSEQSRHAVAAGAELARRHGATLRLVFVLDAHTLRFIDYGGPAEGQAFRDAARSELQAIADGIDGIGPVEITVLEGDPVAMLDQAGNELDLLVLASRNNGPLRRVLLGSVSSKLVRNAPTALFCVPAA